MAKTALIHSLLVVGLGVVGSTAVWAEERSARAELADHYISERSKNPSLFQGTPISHVVPSFNTVSYALVGNVLDTTITPEFENPSESTQLEMSGYEVAPYLSLSLRRIGLGFSVESGHKEAKFSSSYSNGYSDERAATLDYRGVGVFVYWIPSGKIANMITPSVIFGGRSYNAKHAHSSAFGENRGASLDLSYSVPNYEAGVNFDVAMLKRFHVIPWGNYSYIDTRAARSAGDKHEYEADYIDTDVQLFWHDRPDLTYGIDFAAYFGAVQVRLGGLLGTLATSGQGSDRIEDKSLRVAISVEQNGR